VRRAVAGEGPTAPVDPTADELALVCRPNLDVHGGLAGHYRERHGNLRADGGGAVLPRARAAGRRPGGALWFGHPRPTAAELAARHGDPAGVRVRPGEQSVRYLWGDRKARLT